MQEIIIKYVIHIMYFAGDKAKELPRQQRRGGSSTQIVRARDVKIFSTLLGSLISMNKKYQKGYQRSWSNKNTSHLQKIYLKYEKRYRRSRSNIANFPCCGILSPHTISECFVIKEVFLSLISDRLEVMYIFGVKPRTQKLIKCISVFVIYVD